MTTSSRTRTTRLAVSVAALAVLGACGTDTATSSASDTTDATSAPTSATAATTAATTAGSPTPTPSPSSTPTPSEAPSEAPSETPAPTPTAAPTEQARLLRYGKDGIGVAIHAAADTARLEGAPESFKRFIGRTAERVAKGAPCEGAFVGVSVEAVRTDGFAIGGVNDCGGYAAMWAEVDGRWKEILGTQDSWDCDKLTRYAVPSDLAGDTCYDYDDQVERDYSQP